MFGLLEAIASKEQQRHNEQALGENLEGSYEKRCGVRNRVTNETAFGDNKNLEGSYA